MINGVTKIDDIFRETVAAFEQAELYFGHGTESAEDEAAWLIKYLLGISPQSESLDGRR